MTKDTIDALVVAAQNYLDYLNSEKPLGSDEYKTIRGRIVTLACNLADDTGHADRARAYMAEAMAMPNPDSDQEQNWIFGHLITFALREIDYMNR